MSYGPGITAKRARASISTGFPATDQALVAAVPGVVAGMGGRNLRVEALVLTNSGTTAGSVTLKSKPSGAGSVISSTFPLAAGQSITLNCGGDGTAYYQTVQGEGLSFDATGTNATTILGLDVVYSEA